MTKTRKMCGNCIITDTYDREEDKVCRHCNYDVLQESHEFEDAYGNNQRNKDLLAKLEEAVAKVKSEIKTFEEGWDTTWNSDQPEQMEWETPQVFPQWEQAFKY